MSSAPLVSYPVGRSRLQAFLCGLLPLGAVVAWLVWVWPAWIGDGTARVSPVSAATALALIGCGALCTAWYWRHTPEGTLEWNPPRRLGEPGEWRWLSAAYRAGTPVQGLAVMLDVQHTVLVVWRNADGARHWAWLEARRCPPLWWPLRRALHSAADQRR